MTDEEYKQLNSIRKYAAAAWQSLPDRIKDYWYSCDTFYFLQKIFELFGAEELWSNMSAKEIADLLLDSLYA